MSSQDVTGKIQTVLGLIEPSELGITMTHEHLLIDLMSYFTVPDEASWRACADQDVTMEGLGKIGKSWNLTKSNLKQYDINLAIDEIRMYKHLGGKSVVDTTNVGLARDPLALARISRATELNVIMGSSYYVPISHPPGTGEKSEQQIAEEIIRDVTIGVGDTGVKSGVIGEIGNFWPTTENTRKILRASAHAAMETGAPILIHPGFHDDSPAHIMNDLLEAGMDPKRVIIGHLDLIGDMDSIREIGEMGAMLEHDRFGWEDSNLPAIGDQSVGVISDVQRIQRFEQLVEWGFLDRILMAHDICLKTDTTAYGGKGSAHILENIAPRMRKRGWTQEQIDTILVDNPKKILTFV